MITQAVVGVLQFHSEHENVFLTALYYPTYWAIYHIVWGPDSALLNYRIKYPCIHTFLHLCRSFSGESCFVWMLTSYAVFQLHSSGLSVNSTGNTSILLKGPPRGKMGMHCSRSWHWIQNSGSPLWVLGQEAAIPEFKSHLLYFPTLSHWPAF